VVVGAAGAIAVEGRGFGHGETAEEPGVADEGVDEVAGFGGDGVPAVVIFGGEGFEVLGALAGDDEGCGVDAGFEGVGGGGVLAFGGEGSGGTLGVATVGVDLFDAGHDGLLSERTK